MRGEADRLNSNNVGDPRIAMEEEERKVMGILTFEFRVNSINYSSTQTSDNVASI